MNYIELMIFYLIALLSFISPSVAADPDPKSISYVYESCDRSADCWGHLRCIDKTCVPPKNAPTEKKCATPGYKFNDIQGKEVYSCPPQCGFEDHELFGPICFKEIPDCPNLPECSEKGICGYDEKKEICIANEDGCASSKLCDDEGICGFNSEKIQCVASVVGCLQATIGCKEHGLCGIQGERCVASDDGCANASITCGFHGLCASDGLNCVANEIGCQQSGISCLSHGYCGVERGKNVCVASPEGCANSEDCQTQGLCFYREGECRRIDSINDEANLKK